jgi:hypothetical protein
LIIIISDVFAQSDQENNCFQSFLNDQRFISTIESSNINFCDGKLVLIRESDDSTSSYFFKGNELNYNYDNSKACSYLKFNKLNKRKYSVTLKNTGDRIGKTETGEIINFLFKVKSRNGSCEIKKVKSSIKQYHAKFL